MGIQLFADNGKVSAAIQRDDFAFVKPENHDVNRKQQFTSGPSERRNERHFSKGRLQRKHQECMEAFTGHTKMTASHRTPMFLVNQ